MARTFSGRHQTQAPAQAEMTPEEFDAALACVRASTAVRTNLFKATRRISSWASL
jgi:hypothetical protein